MYDDGYLSFITDMMPLEPISFDAALQMCRQIARSFEKKGGKVERLNKELSQQSFGDQSSGFWDEFGTWVTDPPIPIEMQLTINSYNKISTIA